MIEKGVLKDGIWCRFPNVFHSGAYFKLTQLPASNKWKTKISIKDRFFLLNNDLKYLGLGLILDRGLGLRQQKCRV